MTLEPPRLPPVSGHARRVVRRRGVVWYVKYRMPDPTRPGRVHQVEKMRSGFAVSGFSSYGRVAG